MLESYARCRSCDIGDPDEALEITWSQLSEGLTRIEDRAKAALADAAAAVKNGWQEPRVIVEAM